jgi:phosphoglucomutase
LSTEAAPGSPAPASVLVDVPRLITAYYSERPDPSVPAQRVAFGTSGHRGSSFDVSFNEAHVLAITQAICSYRARQAIDGPLFIGFDTHALSAPAFASALEVLSANEVIVMTSAGNEYTPTPAVSHAILRYNRGRSRGLADGIVITPSHNPPDSGGFKYNPPNGGPADTDVTSWIEQQANAYLASNLSEVRRMPFAAAQRAPTTRAHDYVQSYVEDLGATFGHGEHLQGLCRKFSRRRALARPARRSAGHRRRGAHSCLTSCPPN